MSRTKAFLRNTVATAAYQITVMAVGLVTPRILLSSYGSEINGLVSSISQFIAYFSLVEAGISGAAVYSLYKPLAMQDNVEINAIVTSAKQFYLHAGIAFTGLVIALALSYPFFVKTQNLNPVLVGLLVFILGGKGFLDFFLLAKYRVLLTADQKTWVLSLVSTIYLVANMIIVVVLARRNMNIILVYLFAFSALCLRSIMLSVYVRRHYPLISYTQKGQAKKLEQRWDALFQQILQTVQQGVPVLLATIFLGLRWVSVYTIYNMVISGLNLLLGMFTSGLCASFGDVIARNQLKTLQKAFGEFEFAYYSMITAAYFVGFILILPFVRLYVHGISDMKYDYYLIGFLFVLNGLLYNIKTPQGMLVIAAGLYREVRVQNMIQSAIIIFGGIALTYYFQLVGILIAMCLSNLYRAIDLYFFVSRKITQLPVGTTVWRILRLSATIGLLCIPFIWIPVDIRNYVQWAAWAFVVGIFGCAIVLIEGFLFDRNQLMGLIFRIKNVIVSRRDGNESKYHNVA